jgi:ABC-2 type transport system permease protein
LFAAERQKSTLRRLLTSPTRKSTYLFGTIAGQVATALVQMIVLVGFGIIVLKVNWGRAPAALALLLAATALAPRPSAPHWAPSSRQRNRRAA